MIFLFLLHMTEKKTLHLWYNSNIHNKEKKNSTELALYLKTF